jgi:hypothetical protein
VHREVDRAAEQRVFDFLDEEPLAADFGERPLLQPVPIRLDDDDAARRTAGCDDARRDGVGLPERELAPSRPEAKFLNVIHAWCGSEQLPLSA